MCVRAAVKNVIPTSVIKNDWFVNFLNNACPEQPYKNVRVALDKIMRVLKNSGFSNIKNRKLVIALTIKGALENFPSFRCS